MTILRRLPAAALPILLAVALSQDGPMTVYLNHFYVTLDRETYRAIQSSGFLTTEFAPFEQRTTQRQDTTYTGAYFYGRNTYFEFFQEGEEGRATGASAVAFGIETAGGAARVADAWKKSSGSSFTMVITRKTETAEPQWFHMATPALSPRAGAFRTWVMEYHAEFLAKWYPALPPAARSIRRGDVLDRYVAKIGMQERRDRFLMKEVTEIEAALPPEDLAGFRGQVEALGYRIRQDGETTVCSGPDVRLLLRPQSPGETSGIRRIALSLQRPHTGPKEYRFGARSRLEFGAGSGATWWF